MTNLSVLPPSVNAHLFECATLLQGITPPNYMSSMALARGVRSMSIASCVPYGKTVKCVALRKSHTSRLSEEDLHVNFLSIFSMQSYGDCVKRHRSYGGLTNRRRGADR